MQSTDRWGYERLKKTVEEIKKRPGPVNASAAKKAARERYGKLTTGELEKLHETAMKWLKDNEARMGSVIYAEGNIRYMVIEEILNERNVEETLLKK